MTVLADHFVNDVDASNAATHSAFATATRAMAISCPEYHYAAFSISTLLMPKLIKNQLEMLHLALLKSSSAGIIWNILDAFCSLVFGLHQCFQESHAPIELRVKGLTNVLSGTQMIALTFIGFGPAAFAAGFGLGLMHSVWDTYKYTRCYMDKTYRITETDLEKKFLDQKIEKKESELESLKSLIQIQTQKSLNRMEKDRLPWMDLLKVQESYLIEQLKKRRSLLMMDDLERKAELKRDIKQSLCETTIWAIAFSGMLLACLPGCQIPSLVLIAIASIIYILKHTEELKFLVIKVTEAIMTHRSLPMFLASFYNKDLSKIAVMKNQETTTNTTDTIAYASPQNK